MDDTAKKSKPGAVAAARLPYSAPVLKEFGPVSALTQAGTGLGSESMAMGPPSMNPNRRP